MNRSIVCWWSRSAPRNRFLPNSPASGSTAERPADHQHSPSPSHARPCPYPGVTRPDGTGWATGYKTSNGRISTTAGTDKDLTTILELAQQAGYRTGDVSTAELTDATPAVLASHVNARGCQGPLDMASCPKDKKSAGGKGSIAEQMVDHHVAVLLGGGKARFDQKIDGGPSVKKTVTQYAVAQGYQVVTAASALTEFKRG